MPKVTFEGIELEAPQGATVLRACERRVGELVREVAQ